MKFLPLAIAKFIPYTAQIKMIPFNKPFLTGKETTYNTEAVKSGKISGDGLYTK
jgi:hypothetical protein